MKIAWFFYFPFICWSIHCWRLKNCSPKRVQMFRITYLIVNYLFYFPFLRFFFKKRKKRKFDFRISFNHLSLKFRRTRKWSSSRNIFRSKEDLLTFIGYISFLFWYIRNNLNLGFEFIFKKNKDKEKEKEKPQD